MVRRLPNWQVYKYQPGILIQVSLVLVLMGVFVALETRRKKRKDAEKEEVGKKVE